MALAISSTYTSQVIISVLVLVDIFLARKSISLILTQIAIIT